MGVTTRRGRNRYVIFSDQYGQRRNIHLGPVGSSGVTKAMKHIKALLRANIDGTDISDETQEWLDYSERSVRLNLARIGLISFDDVD